MVEEVKGVSEKLTAILYKINASLDWLLDIMFLVRYTLPLAFLR